MDLNIKNLFASMTAEKKRKIVIILGILGILLIFISNYVHTDDAETKSELTEVLEPLSVEEYRRQLEDELKRIISAIDGVGNTEILVTMESTIEDIYVLEKNTNEKNVNKNEESSVDSESEYKEENSYVVIKKKDGSEQTVLQKQVMPKIRGVLVVCDGGDNPVVRENVTKAVSSVLNISTGKVYVTN